MISKEQKWGCYWLTGFSGAGKTSLATATQQTLLTSGINCIVLDGDVLRRGVSKDIGFGREGRRENIRRVAEIASLLVAQKSIVITATISPYREDREAARRVFSSGNFFEVHISTSLEVCIQRDTKKLYARAFNGEIHEFTGINSPYEAPKNPDLSINTDFDSIDKSSSILNKFILEKFYT